VSAVVFGWTLGAVAAGGVAEGVPLGEVVCASAADDAMRAIDVAAGTIHFMILSP